ncbi:MAG TPA: hypothetical protein VEO01_32655 [Pseudonocardiaceae bacterium]|nr:hypothetical protein [Pseudonocardiaceae bacterium]
MTATAVVPAPALPCRWCPYDVTRDGCGGWVHTGGIGYACRDRAYVVLSHSAEPAPPAELPVVLR